MKLEKKETVFTLEGGCDRKNKLLRSDAKLTAEEVGRIDSGTLSIEDLEGLVARKAKIYKYRTQITVHADFPREAMQRVNGYSFISNNKNGSIGIRYGAIDEAKRKRMARMLSYEGFRYEKNSAAHEFVMFHRFGTKEEVVRYVADLQTKYDYPAIRELIHGRIDLYYGAGWAGYYGVLSITVNAIAEANVPEFLRLFRCKSEDEIAVIERERKRKQDEMLRKYREERNLAINS